jgi:hypothetical protein
MNFVPPGPRRFLYQNTFGRFKTEKVCFYKDAKHKNFKKIIKAYVTFIEH